MNCLLESRVVSWNTQDATGIIIQEDGSIINIILYLIIRGK